MYKVYCKDPECMPFRVHSTDAGMDLRADDNYALEANQPVLVKTGIHIEIPDGYAAFLFSRSGLSKQGVELTNGVGVIDSEYRGEIMCSMVFRSVGFGNMHFIQRYQRIAQLVIMPVWTGQFEQVNTLEELTETERGAGGFGHTGKH